MVEPEELSLLDRIEVLPEEMQTYLLNYLEYDEVKRLRRVCNRFRHLAEAYLRRRLSKSYLRIDLDVDGRCSLTQFKSSRFSEDFIIPMVSFYYKGEDNLHKIWEKFLRSQDLDWFMETYAPHVKKLHLRFLQLPICNATQLTFLESFTNLEQFECDLLDLTCGDLWSCYFHNEETVTAPVIVPNSFKSLKKLRIIEVECTTSFRIPTTSELNRFWDLTQEVMKTTCLEELWGPVAGGITREIDLENLAVRLKTTMDVIKSWKKLDKPPKTFSLHSFSELVDLYKDNNIDINLFGPFFELCAQSNVLFEEVFDNYFVSSMGDDFTKYVKTLFSEYPGDLVVYDYSNLELAEFAIGEKKDYPPGPLRCPKLRGLSLCFVGGEDHMYQRQIAHTVFHQAKPNLSSLAIQYFEETPSLINSGDIVPACGNLAYLYLHNCATSSQDFVKLLRGLRCLEHLRISGCENLDDDSFIGDNLDDPAICSLKKLKYLELLGLNDMLGVTDKILTDAIRHIKLRCFRLTSAGYDMSKEGDYETFNSLLRPHIHRFQCFKWVPQQNEGTVSNISPSGILSLKSGVFAETIEKFDLSELHIEGLPNDCLQDIQKEFRSWRF